MDDCEVVVGFRNAHGIFPITVPEAKQSGTPLKVRWWRELPQVPNSITIRNAVD
jgi:hypothetical protein